jgi:hypothetical protein
MSSLRVGLDIFCLLEARAHGRIIEGKERRFRYFYSTPLHYCHIKSEAISRLQPPPPSAP